MRRYLIIYKTASGKAEYWTYAENERSARNAFRNDFIRGDLDYETDGTILSVTEEN